MDESINQIQNPDDRTAVQCSISKSMTTSFSVLLLVAFVGNLITPLLLHRNVVNYELAYKLGGITCGLLLSEFLAIAHWQVFAHTRITIRSSIGIITALILSIGLLLGIQIWPGLPLGVCIIVLAMAPMITLIAWGILSLLLHYGPYYRKAAFLSDGSAKPTNQFGIGTIFLWMTLFATAIFLVKAVVPKNGWNWLDSRFEYFLVVVWFTWLSISIALSSWMLNLAVLSRSRRWLIAYVLTAILGPLFFQWIASIIFSQGRFRFTWRSETVWLLYTVTLGLALGNAITVVMMRYCGVQLEKCAQPKIRDKVA